MGSAVPIHRDCRESEGVPQIQIYSPSILERSPEGRSKEFFNALLVMDRNFQVKNVVRVLEAVLGFSL